jgi:putative hemolysin
MRQPVFTFEFKPTADLLADMREVRAQMAIVLDEYGGTAGIVTIEDLIEEIVGEIVDEYDEVEKEIQVICEDEYVLDGSTKIEDVNEMIGMHLESEHFDTIGGYIIEIMGNLPEVGECIDRNGIRFVIESVDKNRIESIRIYTGIQYTTKGE